MNILEILEQRGFIEKKTEGLAEAVDRGENLTVYTSFDPTGNKLHVGHLLPIMAMSHFQQSGHRPIMLVGGATAMAGDPSGKSEACPLLTTEEVRHNVACLEAELCRFLNFDNHRGAVMVDNSDWIESVTLLDSLRDVGAHFNHNTMLAQKSVQTRLASEEDLSFLEFSYQTMQAFDFLELNERFNCTVQLGVNDKLGNITSGIDYVRKKTGKRVYGLTVPLLTWSSGEKFGKTAGNAVWLDPKQTSPFQFYQFWFQTSDQDVEQFLKYFTLLSIKDISSIMEIHCRQPENRLGQRILATEVTKQVHGEEGLAKANQVSDQFKFTRFFGE